MDIDPKLIPYLIAGGGSALAGGALTAMGGRRPNEGRWSRRWRVLRNALLTGAAGAGATGLIQKGIKDTVSEPLPANDQNPGTKDLHDVAASPITRGLSAAGGAFGLAKKVKSEEQRAAYDASDHAHQATGSNKEFKGVNDEVFRLQQNLKEDISRRGHATALPAGAPSAAVPSATPPAGGRPPTPPVPPKTSLPEATGNLDNSYFRRAGINRYTQEKGGWGKNFRQAAGEEARILGQRLTGAGRPSKGLPRAAILAASLGLPPLIAKLTEPSQ